MDSTSNEDPAIALQGEADDPSATFGEELAASDATTEKGSQADAPSSPQSAAPSVPQAPASGESGASGSSAAPSPQQSHVIHHTAAREEATYKTVHHQASTAREVTVGGTSRIEWTSCPVCGSRHDKAYNERVIDHVTRMGCKACGAYHDSSFDETVWD